MRNTWHVELETAKRRLGSFQEQLGELQGAVALEQERVALLTRLLELSPEGTAAAAGSQPPRAAASPPARLARPSLEDAVVAILSESPEPMHVSDIRQRLVSNGIRIPGKGNDANVISRIIRDDRIERAKGRRGFYGVRR